MKNLSFHGHDIFQKWKVLKTLLLRPPHPPKVYCWKSVFSRPPNLPKVEITPNLSFWDYHTLPKWKLLTISPLRPPYPSKVKIIENLSFQDHHTHSPKVETVENQYFSEHHTKTKRSVLGDLNGNCTESIFHNIMAEWPTISRPSTNLNYHTKYSVSQKTWIIYMHVFFPSVTN